MPKKCCVGLFQQIPVIMSSNEVLPKANNSNTLVQTPCSSYPLHASVPCDLDAETDSRQKGGDKVRKCEICLQSCEDKNFYSSDTTVFKDVLENIYICFKIVITFRKCSPSGFCSNCIDALNIANEFRLKCLSLEKRFFKLFEPCINKSVEDPKIEKDFLQSNENTCISNAQRISNIFEPCINKSVKSPKIEKDSKQSIEYSCISNAQSISNIFELHNNKSVENPKIEKDSLQSFEETCISNDIAESDSEEIEEKSEDYKCSICNKILKSKESLIKHNVSMHQRRKHLGKVTGSGENRRYHCTKCSYYTPHSQTLVNHMRRHNGERPYHCECGKRFTQSSSLAAHRKIHSNTTYYTCATCGKQFKHAFALKKHLLVHEPGKYSCDICQKTLKSPQTLKDHKHRHYSIKNYNCEDCGDTFVTCSELAKHKKKHSSVKEIGCQLCTYRTHTRKNLIIHLKRHAGDKSIKCNLCDLTFYTRGDMRRHHRVHTKEKPFACPTCAQRFTHSPSLNKHIHNVHGLDFKWEDLKLKEFKTNIAEVKIPIQDNK